MTPLLDLVIVVFRATAHLAGDTPQQQRERERCGLVQVRVR